jgi:hypothetical protein
VWARIVAQEETQIASKSCSGIVRGLAYGTNGWSKPGCQIDPVRLGQTSKNSKLIHFFLAVAAFIWYTDFQRKIEKSR